MLIVCSCGSILNEIKTIRLPPAVANDSTVKTIVRPTVVPIEYGCLSLGAQLSTDVLGCRKSTMAVVLATGWSRMADRVLVKEKEGVE